MPGTPFALDDFETPDTRPLRGVAGGRARLTAPTAILLTAWALDEVDMPENRPPVGWSVEGALDGGDIHAGRWARRARSMRSTCLRIGRRRDGRYRRVTSWCEVGADRPAVLEKVRFMEIFFVILFIVISLLIEQ
jgi:hypothetical protein